MNPFYNAKGKVALGSRLRLFTAKLTEDASEIYELYGLEFSPKWFPVFLTIAQYDEISVSAIAEEIGQSQPSVTSIIKELVNAGLVENNISAEDRRKNVPSLTEKGSFISKKIIDEQCTDVEAAINQIAKEARYDLWETIAEWEYLLDQKSLYNRVKEQKKIRESSQVRITPFTSDYLSAFQNLNKEWISSYFKMEDADYKSLDFPQKNIIDQGGRILVALLDDEPVGVCALIKKNDGRFDYELAKMAVSPKARGKNIGWLLGKAIIAEARELGASSLYLESNTILKPAINLYQKLGFQKIIDHPSPYERCNIQMELTLDQDDKFPR